MLPDMTHWIKATAGLFFAAVVSLASLPASGYDPGQVKHGIMVVNHVTYWALKPDGYHPCILLKLENDTGRNLTGEKLRFQAVFVNLRNGQVTRGRQEVRKGFVPKQRIYITLLGNDAFELPISTADWPSMEAKIMARIGDAGDEGTETLTVADLERVAMTDEEAFQSLEKMREFTQISTAEIESKLPAKPMKASPGVLKTAGGKPSAGGNQPRPIIRYLQSPESPGLGDEFITFEQKFGLPTGIEKAVTGWTWASYRHTNPEIVLFAGSSTRKGKVDLLIAQIPAADARPAELLDIARLLAGKSKSQTLSTPGRTVRYLSVGRTELVTAKAPSYQVAYYTPHNQSSHYTIILTHHPGELESLLGQHAQRANMLKSLAALFEP